MRDSLAGLQGGGLGACWGPCLKGPVPGLSEWLSPAAEGSRCAGTSPRGDMSMSRGALMRLLLVLDRVRARLAASYHSMAQ